MHFKNNFEDYISALTPKVARRVRDIETATNSFLYDYYGYLPTAGEIEWPVLEPNYTKLSARLEPFHIAWSKGMTDCVVHFFIDDSLFTRVFRNLEKYIPFLCKCVGVIGTDLSQYTDMPAEMRHRHAFCNVLMSSILQRNGANLYPNIAWSTRDSYNYSFPKNLKDSVIAINSNGVHKTDLSLYRWKAGYEIALQRLTPIQIIRYGQSVEGEATEISAYFFNERLKRLRYGR